MLQRIIKLSLLIILVVSIIALVKLYKKNNVKELDTVINFMKNPKFFHSATKMKPKFSKHQLVSKNTTKEDEIDVNYQKLCRSVDTDWLTSLNNEI